jgi:aminoglycoside phosphotransferase (APT) family kinase protein
MIAQAFPHQTIESVEPLTGGLINTNLKIQFASKLPPVVLRIYRDGSDVCRKEMAIHDLFKMFVPVARILHSEPDGVDGSNPFAILEFAPGVTFQELKRAGDARAIRQASEFVGETLANIGRIKFPSAGRLFVENDRLRVGTPFITGPNPIPRLMDRFLDSPRCRQRAGVALIDKLHKFTWSWSDSLPDLTTQSNLVHSDFGNRNIMVNEVGGLWKVVAVLDWEFAFSGSPLLDVGHFLRYERKDSPIREPHFSQAFRNHGGYLPENWWEIVRVIDLTALVECLTHDNLPGDVEAELLDLIIATLIELG